MIKGLLSFTMDVLLAFFVIYIATNLSGMPLILCALLSGAIMGVFTGTLSHLLGYRA